VLLGFVGLGGGVAWVHIVRQPAEAVAVADKVEPPSGAAPANDARRAAIRDRLAQRISLDQGIERGTPLEDALAILSAKCNVPFRIDVKAYQAIRLPNVAEQPVSFPRLKDVKLAIILDLLLAQIATGTHGSRYRVGADSVTIIPATDDQESEPLCLTDPDPAVLKKLDQPINLDKGIDANTPLQDVMEFLADRYDLRIIVDSKALAAVGVQKAEEHPIQLPPQVGTKLGRILQLITQQVRGDVYRGAYFVTDNVILVAAGYPALAAAAPSGTLLATTPSGGLPGRIVLRHPETGAEIRSVCFPGMMPESMAVAPDGQTLAALFFSMTRPRKLMLYVLDVATGRQLHQVANASPLLFTPDGRSLLYSTPADRLPRGVGEPGSAVVLMDLATGKKQQEFSYSSSGPYPLGFSASARTLAAWEAEPWGTVAFLLLEVASGKRLHRFSSGRGDDPEKYHPWGPETVSRDSKLLVGACRAKKPPFASTLGLWEVATGRRLHYFRGQGEKPTFAPDGRLLAALDEQTASVRLWDVRTGKQLDQSAVWKEPIAHFGFTADGQALILSTAEGTVQRWKIPASARPETVAAVRLAPGEAEKLWQALADEDGPRVQEARLRLSAAPAEAVALLEARLAPVTPVDVQSVRKWIAALDSNQFTVRQQAAEALAPMLELVEADLRQVLAAKPTLELRQRVEALLAEVRGPLHSPIRLRIVRGIDVLELAGTPEAQRLLEKLAQGVPAALATKDAKAALERIAQRATVKP
jgi:hypothetical protein